ncbi:MAG TPA: YjgN family protein, partial [Aquabacterium sp.]|nr:YjgN family protein [Aquabacterium sp.]
ISTGTPGATDYSAPRIRKPFSFTGSGSEYFRIWIVNLLLTLVTLGVYSAWAKVRRTKYFYHNTVVEGSSFEYHGNPIAILKGRAIALVLFIAYNVMVKSGNPWLTFGALGGLAAVMPWLLWKSLQFRAANSSWRGVRFGFGGTVGEAYKTFLLLPLVALVSIYILLPFAHQRIKAWQHSRARFGQTSFSMTNCVRGFYAAYLIAIAAIVGTLLVVALLGGFSALSGGNKGAVHATLMIVGGLYLTLFISGPLMAAKIFNTVWSHTQLGPNQFECSIPLGQAAFVGVTNFLGIIFTLGLFIPWATVRWNKLRAENLVIHAAGPLEDFAAAAELEAKAYGEGFADLGDFDLGL